MEELKSLLYEVTENVTDLTQYTMDNSPQIKEIKECFPFTTFRIITINGKDYCVSVEIQMSEVKW